MQEELDTGFGCVPETREREKECERERERVCVCETEGERASVCERGEELDTAHVSAPVRFRVTTLIG